MAFAICRIQKIKSWGQLKAHETHIKREKATPNANPEVENIQVAGNFHNEDLVTLVRDKIGSQKIRSNAVLAVEMLLSASAEYFRPHAPAKAGIYDKKRLDNFVDATVKWLQSSWGERIIRAELHLDEITPHVHAYLVPLDERGKLNCKALFGTRVKMYQLQDSFAAAVAHLGIIRGIKGSVASHINIRKYYTAVNQNSQIMDLQRCLPQPQVQETSETYRQRVIEVFSPQLEIINYQLNERNRLLKEKAELNQTASRSEQLRQLLERELKLLQGNRINQQDLPLELVAYELGLNQDNRHRNQWLSNSCKISIANSSFHDSKQNISGKSTLELVMHVNQCNQNNAVIWLRDYFGEESMLAAVTQYTRTQALETIHLNPPSAFIPPIPYQNRWAEIEKYLRWNCSLPQKLIQTLHKRGLIYADVNGNAVFLARNLDLKVTGAYLYSPTKTGDAFRVYPGSRRSRGWFHLSTGGSSNVPVTTIVLVSSPIEVLSATALNAPHKHRTLYLVVDRVFVEAQGGYCTNLPMEFMQNVPNIVVAMSTVGVRAIQKVLPRARKIQPYNTWNKQLRQYQVSNEW